MPFSALTPLSYGGGRGMSKNPHCFILIIKVANIY